MSGIGMVAGPQLARQAMSKLRSEKQRPPFFDGESCETHERECRHRILAVRRVIETGQVYEPILKRWRPHGRPELQE